MAWQMVVLWSVGIIAGVWLVSAVIVGVMARNMFNKMGSFHDDFKGRGR